MMEYKTVLMLTLTTLAIYVVTFVIRLGSISAYEACFGKQGLRIDNEIARLGCDLAVMGLAIYLGLSVHKLFSSKLVFPNPVCLAVIIILFGANYWLFLSLAKHEFQIIVRQKRKTLAFSWLLGLFTLSLAGMTILGQ